ncbi:MAG: AzlD domain-containing protein [Oscillospiraceae bacterium]|nr:AzlD domain-containing protein [Oscillospiraceae bacterium]
MLTPTQAALSVAVMAAVTFLTRAAPFLLFDRGDKPPRWVLSLGRILPPAIIAMLVVYCLRGLSFAEAGLWAPHLIASVVVVALQWKFKNDLVSIFTGTVLYMVLVQAVF